MSFHRMLWYRICFGSWGSHIVYVQRLYIPWDSNHTFFVLCKFYYLKEFVLYWVLQNGTSAISTTEALKEAVSSLFCDWWQEPITRIWAPAGGHMVTGNLIWWKRDTRYISLMACTPGFVNQITVHIQQEVEALTLLANLLWSPVFIMLKWILHLALGWYEQCKGEESTHWQDHTSWGMNISFGLAAHLVNFSLPVGLMLIVEVK